MKKTILFFALWLSMGALQVLQAQSSGDTTGIITGEAATPCNAINGSDGEDLGGSGEIDSSEGSSDDIRR